MQMVDKDVDDCMTCELQALGLGMMRCLFQNAKSLLRLAMIAMSIRESVHALGLGSSLRTRRVDRAGYNRFSVTPKQMCFIYVMSKEKMMTGCSISIAVASLIYLTCEDEEPDQKDGADDPEGENGVP